MSGRIKCGPCERNERGASRPVRIQRGCFSADSAAEAESTRPFDGFDKLPFDKLRVYDTASRLRAPSRFDKLKAPSESRGKVEGLTLAATRNRSLNCGI
jgi:hypothetical protein